ncbi:MAG: CehA/McbA family metallohydrolase, partial [Deltaproteobacteria bacterium]|nr:CehA/McbA family metallohydrolase [Deltaproteobacteria bacterium]
FADYRPIVAALGAEDLITASLGNEVSPIMYHFNCLGCTAITGDYFEVAWMELSPEGEVVKGLDAPAVWEILREEFLATMIQINHPREGQGLFDHVGYDPAAGPEGSPPEKLDLNFDAIEVWNGNQGWDHLWSHTLPDWYSFLNRGIRKVATGNSDSHGLSQWIGQPRNLVQAGAATDEAFYGALGAGRSQVTSGPFIELTVGGGGPGDTVVPPSADAALDLTIRVSAATWIPVDTVLLVGNGAVVQEWPVDTHEGILRFEVTVQVAPSYDTWYHVVARATAEDMSPLYPGRESMSFTNPVWVDRDGDGFDPPIR